MSDDFEDDKPSRRRAEAEAAKDEGMDRVEANASEPWKKYMIALVERVCKANQTFCADAIFDLYDEDPEAPKTHDARAFGPVMKRAAKAGFCQRTDRVTKSHRRSVHNHPLAIWESHIFQGEQ